MGKSISAIRKNLLLPIALMATGPMMATLSSEVQAQTSVSITSYGAVADGVTDNGGAIARAIADARARGASVSIPAGNFAYRGVIRLDSVKLVGQGPSATSLLALDPNFTSIFVYGSGAEIRNVRLAGARASARRAEWESTRITLFGARNFVIDNIFIDGSSAAGIQTAQGANNGRITNNLVRNTLSDSIHMTDRASYITLENNRIENAGDDGIAVVSYRGDGGVVHHITARNNEVRNNLWGRNMSIVGGQDILYENNLLDGNAVAACIYIAQEGGYATFSVQRAVVQRMTLRNCSGTATGHAAMMVYSDGDEANNDIRIIRNDINDNRGFGGVRVFGPNQNLVFDSNRVVGNPDYSISSAGVTLIRYTSGAVGYVAPGTPAPNPTPAPTPVPPAPPAPGLVALPAGAVRVAGEDQNFNLASAQVVYYGTNGSYFARTLSAGTSACSNTTFGDPIRGQVKSCFVKAAVAPAPTTQKIAAQRVALGSSAVRRGTSASVTYNFTGGPSPVGMTVFVHFVNSSGQIVFGDDHIPTRSTAQWTGTTSYSRQVAVPASAPAQSYRIRVGLYNPTTGARLDLDAGSGVMKNADLTYEVGTLLVNP